MRSLHHEWFPQIHPEKFTKVTKLLRAFFIDEMGYMEVHPQNRLAILSACENPHSIASFDFERQNWPLPQTGQMTLEDYLLLYPEYNGFCCVTTSYRNEKTPESGRHHKIFPMFEFEMHGGFDKLLALESRLLEFLGFDVSKHFHGDYNMLANDYGVTEIDSATEMKIYNDHGPVVSILNFPEHSNPFWNMMRENGTAKKCDIILHGIETIGSAERSCDVDQMRKTFFSIEGGKYAEKLFKTFGEHRVVAELNEFLTHKFISRSGGGIGLTRLVRAMEMSGLL
jgi:aspartyl/asparaginyl-tRNA synthetase